MLLSVGIFLNQWIPSELRSTGRLFAVLWDCEQLCRTWLWEACTVSPPWTASGISSRPWEASVSSSEKLSPDHQPLPVPKHWDFIDFSRWTLSASNVHDYSFSNKKSPSFRKDIQKQLRKCLKHTVDLLIYSTQELCLLMLMRSKYLRVIGVVST